jgi:hypothetical protein
LLIYASHQWQNTLASLNACQAFFQFFHFRSE